MRKHLERVSVAIAFAFVLVLSSVSFAQTNTASIVGSVKDPDGALVPGAKVTITNNATGITRETASNDSGEFTVPNLAPGNYSVRVEASGFRT